MPKTFTAIRQQAETAVIRNADRVFRIGAPRSSQFRLQSGRMATAATPYLARRSRVIDRRSGIRPEMCDVPAHPEMLHSATILTESRVGFSSGALRSEKRR